MLSEDSTKCVGMVVPEPGFVTSRRTFLTGLGAGLISLNGIAAHALSGSDTSRPKVQKLSGKWGQIDSGVIVTAIRLDQEVARAFPKFNAANVIADFNAKTHGAASDVVLYRIQCPVTQPETGETFQATGLLALPVHAKGTLPVVSWQHGTILSFDQVPSNLTKMADAKYQLSDEEDSLETLFNVQRFAARGFAVIAADYIGKGPLRGTRGEAYTAKATTVATCNAILKAGLAAMAALKLSQGKLFLNGWSQGGLNTQWLHQSLRQSGVQIAGTAAASPFNNLDETWRWWSGKLTFPLPAGTTSYPAMPAWISLCMMVAIGSYERTYRLDGLIEAIIRPKYQAFAREYVKTFKLDTAPKDDFPTGSTLLIDGLFDGYTSDLASTFLRQVKANDANGWHYDSPIRFHYGLADEAIHPALVARALALGGSKTIGVKVANASHRATFLAGMYGGTASLDGHTNALDWFTSLM